MAHKTSSFKNFYTFFWRVRGIVSLLSYPEKTDRLDAAAAAGKTRRRSFFLEANYPSFRFFYQTPSLTLI